ncbi:MAG TPA: class II fructose-bisphosphate aldolase [Candidatus Binataceae bacterium]|nr:class II fructose-bisphosphate aldolase [Candidatus Binataceae bacterium]
MQSLRQALTDADKRKVAVGHFNISDMTALRAIVDAARELKLPVLVGLSEGEREFFGTRTAAAAIRSLRDEFQHPIYLNADHTHSLEKVKEVAEAGYDEVIFDGSKLPYEENATLAKQAVELAKSINPEILVECEIGYIGSSSAILEKRPEESLHLTTPEEARQFAEETRLDVLAPAVGNMHGLLREMVTGAAHKHLDIKRIDEIRRATGKFMTLHGGSGTEDKDFVAAIKAGMTIVHVNTELRLAWRRGVEEGLKDPDEVAPYKIMPPAYRKIREVVTQRLRLFNS